MRKRWVLFKLVSAQISAHICNTEPSRSRLRYSHTATVAWAQRLGLYDGVFESGKEQRCCRAHQRQQIDSVCSQCLISAVKDSEIKLYRHAPTPPVVADRVDCPICKARMKMRNLQRHLNKIHVGVLSELPRQLDNEAECKAGVTKTACTSWRSAKIKCCICSFTVSGVKDLKKHMRKEHYAPRPRAKLRRANVPSSLGRLSMLQMTRMLSSSKEKARSSSVWTVQGGLPDSNRRKH
jgi:hypothetical protein